MQFYLKLIRKGFIFVVIFPVKGIMKKCGWGGGGGGGGYHVLRVYMYRD